MLVPYLIYLLGLVDGNPEIIQLVQFELFPDREILISTMGQLSPEQMRKHSDPVKLTQAQINQYQAVWAALTSDTPSALVKLLTSHHLLNRYTHAALNYMLRRYPGWNQV